MGPAAAPPKTDTPAAYATETDVGSRWDLALRKLTQFSNAPRHDNITPLDQALLHGWAPSTICTYRARLSTLQKFAATLPPDTPDTRVVESFLATLLPRGLAGSTVRTYLSAIKFATDLGWIDCPIPAVWWKLSPAADRLKGDPRRVWFDPTQLRTASPAVPEEFCTLAITIVALSLGLRLGEAASIRPADIALRHDPPGIWFRAEKLAPDKPNRVFRPAPPYVMGWALFLHLANPALPTGDPFFPPAILSRRFSTLFTTPGQPPPYVSQPPKGSGQGNASGRLPVGRHYGLVPLDFPPHSKNVHWRTRLLLGAIPYHLTPPPAGPSPPRYFLHPQWR